ncbi:YjzD family protein [Tuanshanicoccus lijuaniae]|uniref:YjzD family protein n=1 Tax=Aerococcaceae bacterium zg-1292 TaxID=2774330 RepID=UPI00193802C8|nr:YjzD family protein [Aerococcaceae bacterium zg-1292]MBF6625853.1 YjzD family protein [Aerococcaceae bacterium zg-BR9]MBF6978586.1 YjzD family protein [Aerococcaceae bacterium zg-BR22]MBS4455571.1 YjzD family protein [Aerococcaceae bacterium zg-A91]MBS4457190.1 YjzD family protein [Aerococcaceae bacterium zg-BR33]
MKYIATLFWGFILGHVAFYLGSQLTSAPYSFRDASILGIVVAITVFIIKPLITRNQPKPADKA